MKSTSQPQPEVAVISTDATGQVTVFNQSATKYLGYTPEEIVGQTAPVIDFEILRRTAWGDLPTERTTQFTCKTGEIVTLNTLVSVIKDDKGQVNGYLFTALPTLQAEPLAMTANDLPNNLVFTKVLARELKRAEREQSSIAILQIDMDFYRSYAEHYGEQQTIECIDCLATALNNRIKRAGDLLAYSGYDEFFVLLPNTDRSGAVKVAEQLRLLVQEQQIAHEKSPISEYVTISIGIAQLIPTRTTSPEMVLSQTMSALKIAKESGRNCSRLG